GFVAVAPHNVDSRFAPPAQSERSHALGEFERAIFPQKEIHVIELDRVDCVLCRKVTQDRFCPGRSLHFFLVAECGPDRAEAAPKGASYARLVDGGSLPEKRRKKVSFDRQSLIRNPGEGIGGLYSSFLVVSMRAIFGLKGEPADRLKRPLFAQ